MRMKRSAGHVAGAVILGLMIASCATGDARDVQVRDENSGPVEVSPEKRLEQQRQLEERQRDQQQQDRRQQDLERAQPGADPLRSSVYASSITKVPIVVDDMNERPERIVAQVDRSSRLDVTPSQSGARVGSVNGELLRIEGEYFVIRDVSGQEVRLQVTNKTKMENAVQVGDKIEAQVSGGNHAETVRRVETQK